MSAEGKKKRGASGLANAKSSPFRLGGRPANYSISRGNPTSRYGAGSLLVRAMVLGELISHRYSAGNLSNPLFVKAHEAAKRCTHPLLRGDEELRAAAE